MLPLIIIISFKVHTKFNLFRNNSTENNKFFTKNKSVKTYGCDANLFNQADNGAWNSWRLHDQSDTFIRCTGSSITLRGSGISGIYNVVYDKYPDGLIRIENADFNCVLDYFYACSCVSRYIQLIHFLGSGNHVINGTYFKWCGRNAYKHNEINHIDVNYFAPDWDPSLINYNGTSTNSIVNSIFDHPQFGSVQGWEIYNVRCITVRENCKFNASNTVFRNATARQGGSFLRFENNENCFIEGCSFSLCADNATKAHAIYIIKCSEITFRNCTFTDCGSGVGNTLLAEHSGLIFEDNKISFTNSANSCRCVRCNPKGSYKFIGNTFSNANSYRNHNPDYWLGTAIHYEGQANTQFEESIKITSNTFDQITGPNQGRCLHVKLQTNNLIKLESNIFRNSPSGGFLIKFLIYQKITNFTIDSCQFINNVINNKHGGGSGLWIQNFVENENGNNPIFYPFTLYLNNCSFINNNSNQKGGGVQFGADNEASTDKYLTLIEVVIKNSNFSGNVASHGGGAIAIQTKLPFLIENCNFLNNSSTNNGGAIFIETDINVLPNEPKMTNGAIIGCTFEKNSGSHAHLIYIKDSIDTNIEISFCDFILNFKPSITNNYPSIFSKTNTLSINSCTFVASNEDSSPSNKVAIEINNDQSSFNMDNCSFRFMVSDENNQINSSRVLSINTQNVIINNCQFDSCGSDTITIAGNSATTETFEFTNNDVTGIKSFMKCNIFNNSPVIFGNVFHDFHDIIDSYLMQITHNVDEILIQNNTFSGFTSQMFSGGGIAINFINTKDTIFTLIFDNCSFNENVNSNSADMNGNGILGYNFEDDSINNARIEINKCNFLRNECLHGNGGAIYIHNDNDISISNCLFENNNCVEGKGGAIFIGNSNNNENQPVIENCIFNNNGAAHEGGAIYFDKIENSDQNHIYHILNSTFESNKDTSGSTHALYFSQTINKVIIDENCLFLDNRDFTNHNFEGFVISLSSTNFEISDSKIMFTSASSSSSAISLDGLSTSSINNVYFKHTNCKDNSNSATTGVLVNSQIVQFNIDNCTFYCCGIQGNKYAIKILGKHSNIINCNFLNEPGNSELKAGAVHISYGGIHSIVNCVAYHNKVNSGVFTFNIVSNTDYNDQSFTFKNILVFDPIGNDQMGISFKFRTSQTLDIENITLQNVTYEGKCSCGIELPSRSDFEFRMFKYINIYDQINNVGGCGMWLQVQNTIGNIVFTDCIWDNNYAHKVGSGGSSGFGGGILIGGNNNNNNIRLLMKNCTFINNKADLYGGALHLKANENTYIENCTFINNQANDGGAIYLDTSGRNPGIVSINNCIFDNNFVTDGDGSSIYLLSKDSCYVEFSGNCQFINCQSNQNIFYSKSPTLHVHNVSFLIDDKSQSIRPFLLFTGTNTEINDIQFSNCFFNGDGNAIKTETGIQHLYVHDCQFIDSGDQGHSILFQGTTNCSFQNNIFTCTSNVNFIGGILIKSNAIAAINNCSFIKNPDNINSIILNSNDDFSFENINQNGNSNLLISQLSENTNDVSITNCKFDGCSTDEISCFNISLFTTSSFTFDDNTIQNMRSTNHQHYFGFFNGNNKVNSLQIHNMIFINNIANSLFGGGASLLFYDITSLSFYDCQFRNNRAEQDSLHSRPKPDSENNYFNGDGGGIQLGYFCPSNYDVLFERCNFFGNSAFRHGGAIAIQTFGTVNIMSCTFEQNVANKISESSVSLLENHFDLKKQGRGGAIYINPTYDTGSESCSTVNSFMKSVKIDDCTFRSNKAYGGYAIYIEGENLGTEFLVTGNKFFDNYNIETIDKNYSIISTEICIDSLSYETILLSNTFTNQLDNNPIDVLEVGCVDFYGKPVPSTKFTQSEFFSLSTYFTESLLFSKSNDFSLSNNFNESSMFSLSNQFSKSQEFSNSKEFSSSDGFTKTGEFSYTVEFTKSNDFSHSEMFSKSNDFSYSEMFSKSIDFSSTKGFTRTGEFSFTEEFTKSTDFSCSELFSNSDAFSYSEMFSKSNAFSNSKEFSKTNEFSFTGLFSESNVFSSSKAFSYSNVFTTSEMFSRSNGFTKSDIFSKSVAFSFSEMFSESSAFSNTKEFSQSNDFSFSEMFSESNAFSYTKEFSQSNDFSFSEMFSESNAFSNTKEFSQSNDFSFSEMFSESNAFSYTKEFSQSNDFSFSEMFSKSKMFSQSDDFSSSKLFSKSNDFTNSEVFVETSVFSHSEMFSKSDLFSYSAKFTKSEDFSSSILFSKSNDFTKSDAFSYSAMFSKSSDFSYSLKFSQSDDFSFSTMFSKSNIFSISEKFSQSNEFSYSNVFTKSNDFSNTNIFSESNDFTESEIFTKSDSFSISEMFSQSNEFTTSGKFSKTDAFSYSEIFSKSKDFSISDMFSKSEEFSASDKFSKSNAFSFSEIFSESKKFSITEMFSKSDEFSKTDQFTLSKEFSKSDDFTKSYIFSGTDIFANSLEFTKSDDFTKSIMFSKSQMFSSSIDFTKSNDFTQSSLFSNTDEFSKSSDLTKSDFFSLSSKFSQTDLFSESFGFSNSKDFSLSSEFSESGLFSQSKEFSFTFIFSNSNDFSQTDAFSFSQIFSNSNVFSASNDFSNSIMFSESNEFTKSISFSLSDDFSKSDYFSISTEFSKSNAFSISEEFSNSDEFSFSSMFSISEEFTVSNKFSESDEFSLSDKFSESKAFSLSNEFSNTDKFSLSNEFSESNRFSLSNEFSKSDAFSLTNAFSLSDKFSNSDEFSFSEEFSKSDAFSLSNKFSLSDHFSISNEFSKSNDFSFSSEFSSTDEFSFSSKFSKSEDFTISAEFSKSDEFSLSNQFSESNAFSFSKEFSKSDAFSLSNDFSESSAFSFSKEFSKSVGFSLSNEFSYSHEFSKTDGFSLTNDFSQSNEFSKSDAFSLSNDFSESNVFSFSIEFSKSIEFSLSNKFSKSEEFTISTEFSKSEAFSLSNEFTKSNVFSFSNEFSKTDEFSLTNNFSKSNDFTFSNKFSESDEFSFSNEFSESNDFTFSKEFTKTDAFSFTNDFSESNDFTLSNKFSESDEFTLSNEFSESNDFTFSNEFTKTNVFSFTNDFSQSNDFTLSNKFSESNAFSLSKEFSESNDFTFSNEFTKTDAFSLTNDFSESNDFTLSNKFSESDEFTLSNEFSESNDFTFSNEFTKTDAFSCTNDFTKSDIFTKSDVFTISNEFSKSNEFSLSNKFSESKDFSFSNMFSKSDEFSFSSKFSESNYFSFSHEFSKSDYFSLSNEFSKSEEFTISSKFTKSDEFSLSNKFSKSTEFTFSNVFSKTEVFSLTNAFTKSNAFTISDEFLDSDPFTYSKEFTRSKAFSFTDEFSKTDEFTFTKQFSATNEFSKSYDFSISSEFTKSNTYFIDKAARKATKGKNKTPLIIGIVSGLVALIAIVAIILFFVLRKMKSAGDQGQDASMEAAASVFGMTDVASSLQFSNPLYGPDDHDSRDPFNNNSDFDEEF